LGGILLNKGKSITLNTLIHWEEFRKRIIVEGIITGFLVGLIIAILRYILEKTNILVITVYKILHTNPYLLTAWIIFLSLIGLLLGIIVKKEPMISGSGIPQVEGMIIGYIKVNWLRVLLLKLIGTILAIGAGLSLGREGPCVQIGSSIGQGISRLFGRFRVEEKYLITCGASAGLAAAFNAPLAGVIFALEELHKNFSPLVLISAMVSSLTSTFVAGKLLGIKPIFNFKNLAVMPLNNYLYLILLGIIIGLCGIVFNKTLLKTQDIYNMLKIKSYMKPILPLVISVAVGLWVPMAIGGGEGLVDTLSKNSFSLKFLILLLIVKFLFTMVSYGSGVPGGIFMPLLIIGSLIGNIYGTVIINIMHLNPIYIKDFIVFAMAGYFAAIVRAPITGSLLVTEMTGSFSHLLALSTVSITAYLSSDLFSNMPIYESLLERLPIKKKQKSITANKKRKTIFEMPVCVGSSLDGKKLKDISLPQNCLLVGIKRGTYELIPKGNTKILAGDYLIVLADEDKATEIREILLNMTQR